MASAPIMAVKESSPNSSTAIMYFFLGQELVLLERGEAGLGDDVVLEVEDALDILERHVQQRADARRQRLQEPDMRDRSGELDYGPMRSRRTRDSVTSTPTLPRR